MKNGCGFKGSRTEKILWERGGSCQSPGRRGLEIERGKFTAIIGTSGSGKSTLLNMLGGLDTPTEGSIRIGNTELAKLTSEEATVFRRKQIGFIFQNYNLVPVLSVWENIIYPFPLMGGNQIRNLSSDY